MLLATRLIFNSETLRMKSLRRLFVLGFFFSCLSGCALTEEAPNASPISRAYLSSYDEVWRAAQKVLIKYPIMVNNIEVGVLETEAVRPGQFWQAPFSVKREYPNAKYNIKMSVQKGKLRGQESVKVTVAKNLSLQRDFFSDSAPLTSDGMEEKSILYRIERELALERAIKKAFTESPVSTEEDP